MKNILLLAAMLLTVGAKAQDCKYDIDKPDPITGKLHKEIVCKLAKSWKAGFANDAGNISMGLYIVLAGEQRIVINPGDSLIMRLENGQIVSLTALAEVKPTAFILGSGAGSIIASSYSPSYACDAESIRKLSESPIAAMRIFISTMNYTLDEIKGKPAKHIMNAAGCIRQ